jgi:phosphatidylserine/phosphatidylglycerophosphate/cardiolipin synthase-like enzyme
MISRVVIQEDEEEEYALEVYDDKGSYAYDEYCEDHEDEGLKSDADYAPLVQEIEEQLQIGPQRWLIYRTSQSQTAIYFNPAKPSTLSYNEIVLQCIGNATRSIKILMYSFTSVPILNSIKTAVSRGVQVEVVASLRNDPA